ncbi:hypothetical protein, partial [Microvirga arabica]
VEAEECRNYFTHRRRIWIRLNRRCSSPRSTHRAGSRSNSGHRSLHASCHVLRVGFEFIKDRAKASAGREIVSLDVVALGGREMSMTEQRRGGTILMTGGTAEKVAGDMDD